MMAKGIPVIVNETIKGTVEEINTNSVLVSHLAKIDGAEKRIKQWYDIEIVKEESVQAEAQDIFQQLENKGMSKEEISKLVNEGEEKFKEKAILLGILPSDN